MDGVRDFFALPAARRAERAGSFLVSVAGMMERARGKGLHHLQGFPGTGEDTVVCEGCADIFFGIDRHDFSDKRKVLENARRILNAGGRIWTGKKKSLLKALLRISGFQKKSS